MKKERLKFSSFWNLLVPQVVISVRDSSYNASDPDHQKYLIQREDENREIESVIEAAKLFVEDKTGIDALSLSYSSSVGYRFAPPELETIDAKYLKTIWTAAGILFGTEFKKDLDEKYVLPYLLTLLCGDVLRDDCKRICQLDACGYAKENDGLHLLLVKGLHHRDNHMAVVTFGKTGVMIYMSGCWEMSKCAQRADVSSRETYYEAVLEITVRGQHTREYELHGCNPMDAFALWGIDLGKINATLVTEKEATEQIP